MGPISGYQGYYERSWAGTDFAFVLRRVPVDMRDSDAARWNAITSWLTRIAIATRDSDAINHLHNNLVYWAGLDLASIGTVAHRPDLIATGIDRAREGLRDIGPHGAKWSRIRPLPVLAPAPAARELAAGAEGP